MTRVDRYAVPMECASGPDIDRFVCAVLSLRPEWWEQWLPVVAIVLSVVAPFFVAWWVARKSREHTMEAVHAQIEANQEAVERQILAGRDATLAAVERQIAAQREERLRDVWVTSVMVWLDASARHEHSPHDEISHETFRELDYAITRLKLSLPAALREAVSPWLQYCTNFLIQILPVLLRDENKGKALMFTWAVANETLAQALVDHSQSPSLITKWAKHCVEQMRNEIEEVSGES